MKTGMIWMALAAAILVSTSAWAAVWPDTDPALLFNMNFETYNNGGAAPTTTSAKPDSPALVGTVSDYNLANPNVFGEAGKIGVDANFAEMHDLATGAGVYSNAPSPNDLKLTLPPTGLFNLGEVADKHTWTFWFNVPNLNNGTIIRHASIWLTSTGYENLMWEIRIHGGKLHFFHKDNCLKMETASILSDLGLSTDTWYHAAVVIDRTGTVETGVPTTQMSSKIFIDGLEVPIIVTAINDHSMNIDPYTSPLWIGAGEREFDGLLDDVRLFSRDLNSIEVSLLNQPDTTVARALLPIPRSENVVIDTNLTWDPADGAAIQYVYFGTDPENLTQIAGPLGGAVDSADPCAGLLYLDTEYFWYVKTNGVDGPLWSFITETGKALNPSPTDGEEDVNNANVVLSWSTPTAATYTVYASTIRSQLESYDINWFADDLTDPCVPDFDPCDYGDRGQIYYWRVDSNYVSVGTVRGDIWSFRTKPYEIVFNTAGVETTYKNHVLSAYACEVHGDGWTPVAGVTGSLDGTQADGNAIAVFNFNGPNGFSYDRKYDIAVVPALRATDIITDVCFPTPLAIHTTGNFYFDGRIQIAGDNIPTTTEDNTFARSGGFPGPKHNCGFPSIFPDHGGDVVSDYFTIYRVPVSNHGRIGINTSAKVIAVPTAFAKTVWGPGQPVNPPYKGGGGGGNGGIGGEAGRGYYFGIFSGGPSYGDEEVPIPFGGSAGGWGAYSGGAAGGGGIEIVASGNVTFDSNSQIRANGGGQVYGTNSGDGAAGGGGGGGSVRIIASGSVDLKGSINVNGGKGGNAGDKANNCSGGGGGGRVAVFYGASYTHPGTITVNGGAKGTYSTPPSSLAQDGENGTIFATNGAPNSAKKASTPTPADGDVKVYVSPDPCTAFKLKWYSGYGGTNTNDVVKCDTFSPPATVRGTVAATRGQHSLTLPFNVPSGTTYYWKVETDGVSSDIWSFKAVGWYCPLAIDNVAPHVGGPEWDFNHNCVLDFEDFAGFVQDWLNPDFGTYILDNPNFANFGSEFGWCVNRSDGCPGYTNPNP